LRILESLVFLLLITMKVWAEPPVARDNDKDALGKAAVIGYAANIRSFPFYSSRYRFTKAGAASLEDAVKGVFLNAVSFDSRLIVDGDKVMYESLAPPVEPNSKLAIPVPGKKGLTLIPASPVRSDRYLADGNSEMNYCPQLEGL